MIGDILQPTHLLFILVIALLVLGPKRLPEVGRSLGRGLRDFKDAMSGEDRERRDEVPSYTGPESTPPYEPVSTDPVSYPSPESAPAASAPATSAPAASEPADAELVSHPSDESTAPASEPVGHPLVR
jgi:sec-independent protein translocase protein TatA